MKELKKAIAKKILAFTVAGTMLGASVGLTGCDNKHDVSDTENRTALISNKNVYIVVNENGINTLHKGDVVTYIWTNGGYGGPASLPTVLKLNCGNELQTNQYVAYPKICPTPEKYDEVCDCAYQLTPEQQQPEKNKNNNTNYQQKTTSKDGRCL